MSKLASWKSGALIGGLVGLVGLTMYPIFVQPYMNPKKWQDVQKVTRAGIDQEDIQPGGMKVWSDPFGRK